MKKIIKSSILTILFLALLTVVSHAANKSAVVTYGDLNSDGSMQITVTFPDDRDIANSAYDGLIDTITSDGWTVSRSEGTMTKTAAGVNEKPYIRYYVGGPVDDGVSVKVATPYTMKVGDYFDFKSTTATVTASSNTNAVTVSGKRVTAVGVGESTITVSDVDNHNNSYSFNQSIIVKSSDSTPGDNDDQGGSSEGQGTANFSNATYSYNDSFELAICNVNKSENPLYYIIDNNASTEYSESAKALSFRDGSYYADLNNVFGDAIMKAQDAYIHVFERSYNSSYNVQYTKIADKNLPKPDLSALNKFSDRTDATSIGSQFIIYGLPVHLNGTADGVNPRKIHFKIGQITDSSILTAIKNGDSTGFSKLLTYAKTASNPIIDKTENSNFFRGYTTNEALASGSSFSDGAYYYLYLEVDTEDGKYIPIESITISQAHVYLTVEGHPWYLFFYGSDDFNFDGIPDETTSEGDNTSTEEEKLPEKLAKTGEGTVLISIVIELAVVTFVVHRKNKKYSNY